MINAGWCYSKAAKPGQCLDLHGTCQFCGPEPSSGLPGRIAQINRTEGVQPTTSCASPKSIGISTIPGQCHDCIAAAEFAKFVSKIGFDNSGGLSIDPATFRVVLSKYIKRYVTDTGSISSAGVPIVEVLGFNTSNAPKVVRAGLFSQRTKK